MSEWINAEDKLPEKDTDVLVYYSRSKNMAVGFYRGKDEEIDWYENWCVYCDGGAYVFCTLMPDYWMPLPKSPEEN